MRHRLMRWGRSGLTLVELLIVTVIIGILAMIAAPLLDNARERAMVSATKHELRNVANAIELYRTSESAWPEQPDDLEAVGYLASPDIIFCRFAHRPGNPGMDEHVHMVAMHRAADTQVTTRHPIWDGRMEESAGSGGDCGGD